MVTLLSIQTSVLDGDALCARPVLFRVASSTLSLPSQTHTQRAAHPVEGRCEKKQPPPPLFFCCCCAALLLLEPSEKRRNDDALFCCCCWSLFTLTCAHGAYFGAFFQQQHLSPPRCSCDGGMGRYNCRSRSSARCLEGKWKRH